MRMADQTQRQQRFDFTSVIRGFHVYQDRWEPKMNELLVCETEPGNMYDKHAVAVKRDGEIIGHVPMEHSKVYKFFLKRGGRVTATVTGPKINQGLAYGVEIPVKYTFVGQVKDTSALKILLKLQ